MKPLKVILAVLQIVLCVLTIAVTVKQLLCLPSSKDEV